MPGGLLNLISVGSNNQFLTGNPTKTFFNVTYSKYTNFGLQKFRLDYDGQRSLRLTDPSTFTFKVKRNADLLMDTYLVVTLPDIYSPIYPLYAAANTNRVGLPDNWAPYEFRWIRNLGTHMIKEILITCGNLTLQRYSGQYLAAMVDRDFSNEKKTLFDNMSGNIDELNDPAQAFNRFNSYPSTFIPTDVNGLPLPSSVNPGAEPSIRGRTIYIPINTWFTLNSRCAFPLIALQYNELVITVTMRPIRELFQIRDVLDVGNRFPYIAPDFNREELRFYRYLQTPPAIDITTAADAYTNKSLTWNADVHILATYCFLSDDERRAFTAKDQIYLVKDVFEYSYLSVTGTQRLKTTSNGMIANWMWFLQRNDVNTRNEWSNYTNWPYINLPQGLQRPFIPLNIANPTSTPGLTDNGVSTGIFITGAAQPQNQREILSTLGIVLDGEYRENTLESGVFNFVEKYVRTQGNAQSGIYCYNFGLNTDPYEYQPSGAINMSKFKTVELEVSTYVPPVDISNSTVDILCDGNGNPVGIRKDAWQLYQYNYNLVLFEERYNILSIVSGNCGMLYAR
jgi:hypothetical protein